MRSGAQRCKVARSRAEDAISVPRKRFLYALPPPNVPAVPCRVSGLAKSTAPAPTTRCISDRDAAPLPPSVATDLKANRWYVVARTVDKPKRPNLALKIGDGEMFR